jgi:uncharacterized protein YecT (DUF1311 family)
MHRFLAFCLLALPMGASAVQEGEACSAKSELPPNFACVGGEVYASHPEEGGRMGYFVCASVQTNRLQRDMDARYKDLLRTYGRKREDGPQLLAARSALIKSQAAWLKFAAADCELTVSFIGAGNGNAGESADCWIGHLTARIGRLKALRSMAP